MTTIHPTAIVDPKAELDESVEVGPFCIIEAGVTIGAGTTIGPQVHIEGITRIGTNNTIGTGCTLGLPPQHMNYKGEPTALEIGSNNTIREYANIHRSCTADAATRIGSDCYIMGFAHVGHDCVVGDRVILVNSILLGGHVTIGDGAFISGHAAIHQFCRIGSLAMISGLSAIANDVPPYMTAEGRPGGIRGMNSVGLKRAGFGPEVRKELKRIFHSIYKSGKKISEAIEEIKTQELSPEAQHLIDFYESSKRGFTPLSSQRKNSL